MAQYFTRPKSMAVEGTVFKSSEFHTKIDRKKKKFQMLENIPIILLNSVYAVGCIEYTE